MSLDSFAKINLRSTYEGSFLTPKLCASIQSKYISQYMAKTNEKITQVELLLTNVKEFLEARFGPSVITRILPHYEKLDIVFCFDESGNPVTEVLDRFPSENEISGEILWKQSLFKDNPGLMQKYQLVAVVVGNRYSFMTRSDKPTGFLRMKLEQLEMVGYKPIRFVTAPGLRRRNNSENILYKTKSREF